MGTMLSMGVQAATTCYHSVMCNPAVSLYALAQSVHVLWPTIFWR